ncbi:MAG TPA: hypothetical protein VFE63_09955 [Roseiarcus sp.]|jgi:hypothetical protein|nr:hypothetical protein [Roseiarcus sp.]
MSLAEPHAKAAVIISIDEDDAGGLERLANCIKIVRHRVPDALLEVDNVVYRDVGFASQFRLFHFD